MTGIYCIENTVNHKKYIGMAQDIEARWRAHKCELRNGNHINRHLQKAWNKYGENAFAFYVLEEVEKSKLQSSEIAWIAKLGTFKNGYNLTAGGEGQFGRILTEDQKRHLSEINMGKNNPNYGLKRSEETRRRMSESMMGKHTGALSESHRKAISDGNKGKKHPWLNKPVIHIETGETFKSISEASEKTGFSISGICDVCIKRRKTIYKQHFQFIEG